MNKGMEYLSGSKLMNTAPPYEHVTGMWVKNVNLFDVSETLTMLLEFVSINYHFVRGFLSQKWLFVRGSLSQFAGADCLQNCQYQ